MAAGLRLDVPTIAALEGDEFKGIPATYARGYLRSYARLLDIPEERIVQAYERLNPPEPPPPPRPQVKRELSTRDRSFRWISYVIIALVLVLPLAWWQNEVALRLWQPGQPAAGAVMPIAAAPVQAPVISLPMQAPQRMIAGAAEAQAAGPAVGRQAAAHAPAPVETLASVVPAPEPATVAAPEVAVATPEEVPAAQAAAPEEAPAVVSASQEASGEILVLRFTGDSWVEVRDAQGQRMVYGLARAGSTRTVEGDAPFKVVLGNSPAVSVEFNGQPFDQTDFHRGNVARFTIGATARGGRGT